MLHALNILFKGFLDIPHHFKITHFGAKVDILSLICRATLQIFICLERIHIIVSYVVCKCLLVGLVTFLLIVEKKSKVKQL